MVIILARKQIPLTKLDSNTRNKIAGSRLKECMKSKNMKLSEMAEWIYTNKGMDSYSIQYISQMRNGHRAISAENAFMFSECLEIDSGYLLGKDFWLAKSYDEYLGIMKDMNNQLEQQKSNRADLHLYDSYLKDNGYKIEEAVFYDMKPKEYHVSDRAERIAVIPASEMKKFKKAIDEQIQLRMKALMDKYKT